jgi:hypothetical protein
MARRVELRLPLGASKEASCMSRRYGRRTRAYRGDDGGCGALGATGVAQYRGIKVSYTPPATLAARYALSEALAGRLASIETIIETVIDR